LLTFPKITGLEEWGSMIQVYTKTCPPSDAVGAGDEGDATASSSKLFG